MNLVTLEVDTGAEPADTVDLGSIESLAEDNAYVAETDSDVRELNDNYGTNISVQGIKKGSYDFH